MRSRALFFTITTAIAVIFVCGVGYALYSAFTSEEAPTVAEPNNIRINKTVQGEVVRNFESAGIVTIKSTEGDEFTIAIVPETKITDVKNNSTDSNAIQNGFVIEGRGEIIAKNILIASEVRIVSISEIIVKTPVDTTTITSPLKIEGMAKGTWYFEASLPVEIVDAQHRLLGKKFVTATSDWMTESLVPFTGELEFQKPTTKTGFIVFRNDNPSGLKENEKTFEMPITFEPATITVKAFFNNSKLDPAFLCNKVFPVSREIAWTEGVGRAAIEELLKGPSEQEAAMNYFTNINKQVVINNIAIDNGTARIDFSEELNKNTAGSCRVTAIRSQITETLKQFPTVKSVIISVNGRVDDILQP